MAKGQKSVFRLLTNKAFSSTFLTAVKMQNQVSFEVEMSNMISAG